MSAVEQLHFDTNVDKRSEGRRKIYSYDQIKMKLSIDNESIAGDALDFSHSGFSMVVKYPPDHFRSWLDKPGYIALSKNHSVQTNPMKCRITDIQPFTAKGKNSFKVSMKRVFVEEGSKLVHFLQSGAWKCSTRTPPICYAQDPIFFDQVCVFVVEEFHSKGCKVNIDEKICGFCPGNVAKFEFLIAPFGKYRLDCKVIHDFQERSGNRSLWLEFQEPSPHFAQAISDHIMANNAGVKARDLKRSGFFLGSLRDAVTMCQPQSESDWKELLKLRQLAYQGAGKFKDVSTYEEMEDAYDRHSRQIVAKSKGEVVGAIRVVFNDRDLNKAEHKGMGIDIPEFLTNTNFVEFMRLCVHPDFQGTQIALELMKYAGMVACRNGAKYALSDCVPELLPLYKKIGFKPCGVTFAAFGRDDNELIYLDFQKTISGRAGDFFMFNQIILEAAREHSEKSWSTAWKQKFHKLIQPMVSRVVAELSFRKLRRKRK